MSEKLSIPENSSGKRPDYDANDPNPGDRAYQEVVLPDANIEAKKEGIDLNEEKTDRKETTREKSPAEEKWFSSSPEEMLILLEKEITTDEGKRKLCLFLVACCRDMGTLNKQESSNLNTLEGYANGKITKEELMDIDIDNELGQDGVFFAGSSIFTIYSAIRTFRSEDPLIEALNAVSSASSFVGSKTVTAVRNANRNISITDSRAREIYNDAVGKEAVKQAGLLRDVFGNPFNHDSMVLMEVWLTKDVLNLAQAIYEEERFEDLPVLADALEEAGCNNEEILNHLRGPSTHVRGCWCLDLILQKEEKQEDEKE